MPTHPLWRPFELTDLEVDVVVTQLPPSQVVVTPYDDAWPEAYARVESLVRDALGALVLAIEHTGSTSVPGLAAKPVIDAVLTVPDRATRPPTSRRCWRAATCCECGSRTGRSTGC